MLYGFISLSEEFVTKELFSGVFIGFMAALGNNCIE